MHKENIKNFSSRKFINLLYFLNLKGIRKVSFRHSQREDHGWWHVRVGICVKHIKLSHHSRILRSIGRRPTSTSCSQMSTRNSSDMESPRKDWVLIFHIVRMHNFRGIPLCCRFRIVTEFRSSRRGKRKRRKRRIRAPRVVATNFPP